MQNINLETVFYNNTNISSETQAPTRRTKSKMEAMCMELSRNIKRKMRRDRIRNEIF
jgi:hypothetical protein